MPAPAASAKGRYELLRRLAVGGMAEIFLARAAGLEGFEKLVVLKQILPQHAADPQFLQMFLDEARLMATLSHPNIAQVYDVGREGSRYFFTMEYVHGEDLRQVLSAQAKAGATPAPLPLEHAVGILAGAAAGLHHAHEATGPGGTPLAIVHRDMSPSNVLVGYDGSVKVTDFGVAKWASQRSETRHGTLKGKVGYMSPEQCRAEPLDRRSDVFALGLLLYEATTGARAFEGDSDFDVLTKIVGTDPTPPSARRAGYPAELERIVMRALERDRAARFATAEEMLLALEAFARESRLPVSQVSLGRTMASLFPEKVDAWQRARAAGKTLGEHLATGPTPATPALSASSLAPTVTDVASPGVISTRSNGRPATTRRGLVFGLGAVALAVGAIWLAGRDGTGSEEPSPFPPPQAPRVATPSQPTLPVPAPVASATPPATPTARPRPAKVRPTPPPAIASPDPNPTPAPTAPPSAPPTVKVWDPDSPVPP